MADDLRIIVEKSPPESRLKELNIKCWPKWGYSPGRYQLKVRGRGDVLSNKRKGQNVPERVGVGGGVRGRDLIILPKGLSCTWDVSVAVDKYYKFESTSPTPPSSSSFNS